MNPPGPYRIAHLSDIHFGSTFDSSLWKYLKAVLKRVNPKMIAVTGDVVDHGGLFMLLLARNELDDLAKETNASLRVIPGNHDVGLWGNIGGWPISTHFGIAFAGIPTGTPNRLGLQAVLRCLPPFTRYRSWPWVRRLPFRIAATLLLFVLRATLWLFAPGVGHLPIIVARSAGDPDCDPDEPFLAYINSNDAKFLATGNVDVTRLGDLQAHVAQMSQRMASALVPRIALMHHHALPIPYSNVREGLTSFEPFLVLRNAGTLLKELTRNDFDIVLHGHKHYSSFMRLGYTNRQDVEGELAVIAAGSAGVTFAEAGRNSINVIEMHSNGYMLHVPVYYGGGQSISSVATLLTRAKPIHPIPMLKRRAFRRAFEVQGRECALLERDVLIDRWGTAEVVQRVEGFAVGGTTSVDRRTINFRVKLGRIHPDACVLDDDSVRQGFGLDGKGETPTKRMNCIIDLNRAITSASKPINYGIKHRSINTFLVGTWEAGLLKRGEDWVSLLVRFPTRRLRLTVKIPDGVTDLRPRVSVRPRTGYPDLKLDTYGDLDQTGDEDYDVDAAMTEHEKDKLSEAEPGTWVLDVGYPIVGFQYRIEWKLRLKRDDWDGRRAGEAAELRCSLLRAWQTSPTSATMAHIESTLLGMHKYLKICYGSKLRPDETMRLALFIFDEQQRVLRRIAEVSDAPTQSLLPFEIPMGEGVAYRAFSRGSFQLYRCPALQGGLSDGSYLYWPDGTVGSAPDYAVLAAFPMLLPNKVAADFQPMQETIGVFSVATDALDSGLLSLSMDSDRERPGADDEWKRLPGVAAAFALGLQTLLQTSSAT